MQQNITFRNSPPSASSMRDGQIVFARNSKGVAMYTKQGSQLFHTQFNSSANIDKSLNKITPRSVEAGDLSYTKFTDYRTFIHNFNGDITTTKYYIPWAGTDENAAIRGYVSYLAPFKMTFYKLLLRTGTLTADANYTFTIELSNDKSTHVHEVGNYQLRNKTISSTDDDTYFAFYGSDFFINSPFNDLSVNVGEKVGISIQADNDPSGTTDWQITSVWKVEVDLS